MCAADNPTSWNSQEDDHLHEGKKLSVFGKVKEKAKKWRQLAKRKFGQDYHTPSWEVALEDSKVQHDEHENVVPQAYPNPKSTSNEEIKQDESTDQIKIVKQIMNSGAGQHLSSLKLSTPNHPVLTKSQSDTFGDYTSKSEANPNINEEASPRALSLGTHLRVKHSSPSRFTLDTLIAQRNSKRHHKEMIIKKEKLLEEEEGSSPKKGDEEESKRKNIDDEEENKGGVWVKEYLKTKLEPGEDERALSQVIAEVMSPRRNPNEKGIVEKVRAAVTMFIQADQEPSSSSLTTNTQIPVSTNACQVEEENHGRMLQSN
ncbi:unnamed protein product [Amaranthus hypochondriacus]